MITDLSKRETKAGIGMRTFAGCNPGTWTGKRGRDLGWQLGWTRKAGRATGPQAGHPAAAHHLRCCSRLLPSIAVSARVNAVQASAIASVPNDLHSPPTCEPLGRPLSTPPDGEVTTVRQGCSATTVGNLLFATIWFSHPLTFPLQIPSLHCRGSALEFSN